MDGIEFILTAIVVSVYILIGLMIAFVGLVIASLLSHIFSVRIVRERR
jgi:hypothetical protein